MSKFVIVKEAPKDLKDGEYLIDKPSFLTEIALHKAKAPKNGLTALHHLRALTEAIAHAYDPENMSGFSIKAFKYEGRPFSSDEDLNSIMVEALKQDYPAVFQKYLDVKIKARPSKTSLVYYVDSGIRGSYEIFYKNGLSELEKETVQKVKSDKIVGKPAITKEQAEALKKDAVDQ